MLKTLNTNPYLTFTKLRWQGFKKILFLVIFLPSFLFATHSNNIIINSSAEIPMPTSGTTSQNICSGTFVDSGTSTGDYSNSESGILTICPDAANSLIQADFSIFNIENNDFFIIYDGDDINAPFIGNYTETNSPGVVASSHETGCLTFRFISNGSVVEEGWVAEMTCLSTNCVIMIDNIAQTNCGDGTYDAQVTVEYAFLDPANQIRLSEAGGMSQVFNTTDRSGITVFTLTGLTTDGQEDIFTAEDANDSTCSAMSSFTASCDCSITIDNIAIANCAGSTYEAAISVTYEFLNSGQQISITETNSGVSMTFSTAGRSASETFVLSGLTADGSLQNFVVNDAIATSCMVTDNTFVAPPDGCAPEDIIMGTTTGTITTCNGKFYDSGGIDNDYSVSESTSVTICPSTTNSFIHLDFTSFSTEDSYDHLWVYNGPSIDSPLISTGGTEPTSDCSSIGPGGHRGTDPFSVESSDASGCLSFYFCSDASVTEPGWVADVSCVPIVCIEPLSVDVSNCTAGTYSADVAVKYQFLESPFEIEITEVNSGISNVFVANNPSGTEVFSLDGLVADADMDVFTVTHLNNPSDGSCTQSISLLAPPSSCINDLVRMGEASPVNTCYGSFYDSGGATGAYTDDESATMTICPNKAERVIQVHFNFIAVESSSDPLFIYNGDNTSAPLINSGNPASSFLFACNELGAGGYWGNISDFTVTSTHSTGCLTFQFCSDILFTDNGWDGEVTCISTALPLELSSFYGTAERNANHLEWITSTERNTKFHLVERSLDGQRDWQEIGKLAAQGDSQYEMKYEWFDEAPLPVSYYRIKTVDTDGKTHDSESIVIKREHTSPNIIMGVSPIPTTDELNLQILAPTSIKSANISVSNMMGQVVYFEKISLEEGGNVHAISLDNLSAGMYLLILENGSERIVEKIIKK